MKLLILNVAIKDRDIPIIKEKMLFLVDECGEDYQITPDFLIQKGVRPYATIKTIAEELNPELVVLKHSGVGGIKRYTGIRTIKILSGTTIPFVVIQDAPQQATVQNIIFPVNFIKKHDTKLKQVVYYSRFFPDAVMSIITPSGKDTEKEKTIAFNIKMMTKAMEEEDIKIRFITHDKKKNTAEDIIHAAKKANADLIITPTEDVPTVNKFLFGLREEKLISNTEKIPVLCINSTSPRW
ncbi:MAG: universal stress protein [Bacteroidales bacterium]|nr:universal stress protein [Bacteroidales bacterium]